MLVRISWRKYALELAKVASQRSEDPFVKVGACALRRDNTVAGLGYNGAPAGVEIDWEDRDDRRKRVIHAEVNALRYTKPGECKLIATTLLPCNECLKLISAYGIETVIFDEVYQKDYSTLNLAKEFNIELVSVASLNE